MGKDSRRKKRLEEARIHAIVQSELQAAQSPKKKKSWGGRVGILAALLTIVCTPIYLEQLKRTFMSKHDRYETDNYVQGELKPVPLKSRSDSGQETLPRAFLDTTRIPSRSKEKIAVAANKNPSIKGILIYDSVKTNLVFLWGSSKMGFSMKQLEEGVTINSMVDMCGPVDVTFKLKNNRIYTSARFNSLLNDENIGTMDYNHWRIYLPNVMDWKQDDERLEVRDKQNNIVFTIHYLGNGNLSMGGYFLDESKIFVLVNDPSVQRPYICIPRSDPNWKSKAASKIGLMKPIFE